MKKSLILLIFFGTTFLFFSNKSYSQCSLLSIDTMYYDTTSQEIKGNILNGSNWYVIYPSVSISIDSNKYLNLNNETIIPSYLDSAGGFDNGITPFFFTPTLYKSLDSIPINTVISGTITIKDFNAPNAVCIIPFQWQIRSANLITSINVKKAINNLEIYPNPVSNNILNFNFEGNQIRSLHVYSLNGSRLINVELPAFETNYQLNVNELIKGIYLIRVLTNEGWIVKKITKL